MSPASVYSQKRILELKSHRVTSVLSESSGASHASCDVLASDQQQHVSKTQLAELQDTIQDLEEELSKSDSALQDAKALEETRKKEVESLGASLLEANDSIRCLKVELDALTARHAESVRLSETYIAEARLSRDEEVARLEQRIGEIRRAGEEQLDAVKAITGELRQENEALKSSTKKMEQAKRDAEREMQRAVNRFEAAVQSLEQLEHQYALLEKDAKETEAVKMERILSLEQEVEELRVAKGQTLRQLEQREEALKDAEQRQRRAEAARDDALGERDSAQAKLERLEAMVDKVSSENRALVASQAKLQGASDGAAEVHRSMHAMLETYEKENAALVSDLDGVRERLAVLEGRRREELDEADGMRKRASKAERLLEEASLEASQREQALQMRLEALEREHEAREAGWKAERESLTRELEVAVGQLSVVSADKRVIDTGDPGDPGGVGSIHQGVDGRDGKGETQSGVRSEVAQATTQNTQTFYSADDGCDDEQCGSVSIGDGVVEGMGRIDAARTPDTVTSGCRGRGSADTNNDKEDLKAQLTALKLSLMRHCPGVTSNDTPSMSAKTSFSSLSHVRRTGTGSSFSGYLQAHRPLVMQGMDGASPASTPSSASTCSDDDDLDASLDDQLAGARASVRKAKACLSKLGRA